MSGGPRTPAAPGIRPAGGAGRPSTSRAGARSNVTAIGMALTIGLCAGYLDAALIVFKKMVHESGGILPDRPGFPVERPGGPCGADANPRDRWSRSWAGSSRGTSRPARGRGCSRRWRCGGPCCGCRCMPGVACCWPPGWPADRRCDRGRAARLAADAIRPGGRAGRAGSAGGAPRRASRRCASRGRSAPCRLPPRCAGTWCSSSGTRSAP